MKQKNVFAGAFKDLDNLPTPKLKRYIEISEEEGNNDEITRYAKKTYAKRPKNIFGL
jgi:hypothetical protein